MSKEEEKKYLAIPPSERARFLRYIHKADISVIMAKFSLLYDTSLTRKKRTVTTEVQLEQIKTIVRTKRGFYLQGFNEMCTHIRNFSKHNPIATKDVIGKG